MSNTTYKSFEGNFSGKDLKIAIVVSRFNELISSKLLSGALDCLQRHEVASANISIVWVPGAFEIPLAAKKIIHSQRPNAVITLGAVIRGDTPHFDYVCSEVSKGVSSISLSEMTPCILGVLTTESIEQALERAGTKAGNKGWEAAMAALELGNLYKNL